MISHWLEQFILGACGQYLYEFNAARNDDDWDIYILALEIRKQAAAGSHSSEPWHRIAAS